MVGRGFDQTSDTKSLTLNLFKSGKSLPEIMAIRNLAQSTIESHLAHFVWTGDVKIEELVPPEKISPIIDAIHEHGDEALSPLKTALGDGYSYGEIRAVVNWLRNKNHAPE